MYPAALKARENYAYEDAIKYLLIYKELLEKNKTGGSRDLIECTKTLGEIYLIIGKNDEALSLFQLILPKIKEKLKKAHIYMNISQAYFKKWDCENCEYFAKAGLELLGEKLPLQKKHVMLEIIKEVAKHLVHMLLPGIFIRKKKIRNYEKYQLLIWFYYSLSWMYIIVDTLKFTRTIFRALNICVKKIGLSKEYAMYLGGTASVLMAIPLFKISIKYHNKALHIKRMLNDRWGEGQSLQVVGCYYQWKGDFQKSTAFLRQSLEIMKSIGDLKEMAFTMQNIRNNYWYLGLYKDALLANQQYYEMVKKAKDDYAIADALATDTILYIEKGDYEAAQECLDKLNDIKFNTIDDMNFFERNCHSGLLSLKANNSKEAIKKLEKAKNIFETNNLLMQYSCLIYNYLSGAYMVFYNKQKQLDPGYQNRGIIKKISKYCRHMWGC